MTAEVRKPAPVRSLFESVNRGVLQVMLSRFEEFDAEEIETYARSAAIAAADVIRNGISAEESLLVVLAKLQATRERHISAEARRT